MQQQYRKHGTAGPKCACIHNGKRALQRQETHARCKGTRTTGGRFQHARRHSAAVAEEAAAHAGASTKSTHVVHAWPWRHVDKPVATDVGTASVVQLPHLHQQAGPTLGSVDDGRTPHTAHRQHPQGKRRKGSEHTIAAGVPRYVAHGITAHKGESRPGALVTHSSHTPSNPHRQAETHAQHNASPQAHEPDGPAAQQPSSRAAQGAHTHMHAPCSEVHVQGMAPHDGPCVVHGVVGVGLATAVAVQPVPLIPDLRVRVHEGKGEGGCEGANAGMERRSTYHNKHQDHGTLNGATGAQRASAGQQRACHAHCTGARAGCACGG